MAEVRADAARSAADVVSVTSGNERLRPLVLRAAEHGNADELRILIQQGKQDKTLNDSLLRWALQKAAERGQKGTVDLLLLENVDWDSSGSGDKALSPLYRAVQRGHKDIVKTLLERGANLEAVDKHGRSVIHAAAWWNRADILRMLISHGANVNSRDHESKRVLHGLASDKSCRWGPEIIDILLATPIDLEYPDDLKRTALHWAAVSGKENLTRQLLLRKIFPRADVHATTDRGKTALHLAAQQGHAGVVDILLDAGADPMARSDGGWTALHNAAHKGHAEVIEVLVLRGCNVNVCTSAGMTALHWASQEGRAEAVSCLLRQSDVWRNPKDVDDRTPLVCAAESKHAEVVKILAPLVDVDKLSHDAIGACNSFMATIVDFGINGSKVSQPTRKSVYEVLYGRDPKDPDIYSVTTMVKNMSPKPSFRWIHLPANNMAWVETLITKAFIEDGAADVEGLKALQGTFGQHHRGPTIYSRSMRPQCARIQRSDKASDEASNAPKATHDNEAASLTRVLSDAGSATPRAYKGQENGTPKGGKGQENSTPKGGKGQENGTPKGGGKQGSKQKSGGKGASGGKNTANNIRKERGPIASLPRGNMVLFAPYLHFETERKRAEMQRAIRESGPERRRRRPRQATTADEMLIRAYLHSSTQLHVRRSHDQFFLHEIVPDDESPTFFHGDTKDGGRERKVLMVDQLWMWILGRDLIITSFPQRWEQPRNDPYNVLDGITEGIYSRSGEPVKSVYDLATLITSRCLSVFDRHRMGNEDNQLLNMFEATIGKMVEEESVLFSRFYRASSAATNWLKRKRRTMRGSGRPSRYEGMGMDDQHDLLEDPVSPVYDTDDDEEPLFVDSLLDVGKETMLMTRCKEEENKLDMVFKILEDQKRILQQMQDVILEDLSESAVQRRAVVSKKFHDLSSKVGQHSRDIERMKEAAEYTYKKILPLLDLKQKHANAFEARFARDQAASSARQGQVIMVFTIVTIVFLPMSFISSFMTIDIAQFPRDGLSLGYVSKIIFPIGLGISLPLIALAFSLNSFKAAQRSVLRSLRQRQQPTPSSSTDDLSNIHALSRFSKDEKRSFETGRSISISPAMQRTFSNGSAWSRSGVNGRARWADVEAARK